MPAAATAPHAATIWPCVGRWPASSRTISTGSHRQSHRVYFRAADGQASGWGTSAIGAPAAGLLDLSQDPASLVLARKDLRGGNRKLKGFASVVLFAHLAIGHPEVVLHLGVIG